MAPLKLSETLREEAKTLINEKVGGWDQLIKVVGLHSDFTQEALEHWVDRLIDHGRTTLGIASGIAVMKGYTQVTSTEIEQAFRMKTTGINKVLPAVRQTDGTWNDTEG